MNFAAMPEAELSPLDAQLAAAEHMTLAVVLHGQGQVLRVIRVASAQRAPDA